jgi:recombination protein RecA
MVSAQAYSKTIEDRTYGGISMALTLFSKEMIPVCARTGCTLIGINQVREDMNSTYGGTTTTGGRAWRHNCSVRMTFQKSDYLDDKGNSIPRASENPVGHLVKVALVKSKICKLDRKVGFYTLKYLTGIDYISDIIDLAIKAGIVNAAGAWYSILDESGNVAQNEGTALKFQGKARLHAFLSENADWADEINEQVLAHFS